MNIGGGRDAATEMITAFFANGGTLDGTVFTTPIESFRCPSDTAPPVNENQGVVPRHRRRPQGRHVELRRQRRGHHGSDGFLDVC